MYQAHLYDFLPRISDERRSINARPTTKNKTGLRRFQRFVLFNRERRLSQYVLQNKQSSVAYNEPWHPRWDAYR